MEVANLEANSSEDDLDNVQDMHDVNDGSFASSTVFSSEEQIPTARMSGWYIMLVGAGVPYIEFSAIRS